MTKMEEIYQEIASKYGVSVEDIKRDIQEAINEAYADPTPEANSILRTNEIPTPDEFIKNIAHRIQHSVPDDEKDNGDKE